MSDHLELELLPDFEVVTRLGKESIIWNASQYSKASYNPANFDLFTEINSFLKRQPPEISKEIFECYKEIETILFEQGEVSRQTIRISRIVVRIGNLFDYEAMARHVRLTANVVIPSSFEKKYTQIESVNTAAGIQSSKSAQSSTREKTYLYEDYVELVGFTIFMRLMFPIWGAYMSQYTSEIGTAFKEIYACSLIRTCPNIVNSSAYQKLYTYVSAMVEKAEKQDNTVMDGLAREDFPLYSFSLILVRRIATGDVRGVALSNRGVNTHLVTYIHNFIKERILLNPKSFSLSTLVDKTTSSSKAQDEESKLTDFEAVRVSEESTPGDYKEINFYIQDTDRIVKHLCPDISMDLVNEAIANAGVLSNAVIHDPQFRIMQWMIGPYLPPLSLYNVDKVNLVKFAGVCQAIFWHHGLRDLAAIMTITEYTRGRRSTMLSQITRSNIPGTLIEEARRLYPHYRRASGRIPVTPPEPVVVTMVKTMTNELLDKEWEVNMPRSWGYTQANATGLRPKEFRIPGDIRIQLMMLVNRIGTYAVPFAPQETNPL